MHIKFNSLNLSEKPMMYVCNPGCQIINNKLTNVVGILSATSDEEIVFNFNETSELNFRAYRISSDDYVETAQINNLYRALRNRRMIFIEGIGFFVITSVKESYEKGIQCKDVTAETCEVELENKNIAYVENGTYQFMKLMATIGLGKYTTVYIRDGATPLSQNWFSAVDGGVALSPTATGVYKVALGGIHSGDYAGKVFYWNASASPGQYVETASGVQALGWEIRNVDPLVSAKYRTFEDIDTEANILSFVIDNVQNAYECIFVFNPIDRTIDVYDQSNYVKRTNIHITKDDLINSMGITEESDDLYTAISVMGSDDLNIVAVNPIGTNVIYNFDYYLDWMTDELREKVEDWQELVAGYEDEYVDLNTDYYAYLTTRSNYQHNIDNLNIQLTQYNRCYENLVAELQKSDASEYVDVIPDQNIIDIIGEYNKILEGADGTQIPVTGNMSDILSYIASYISQAEADLASNQELYDDITEDIDELHDRIVEIHEDVDMTTYFTTLEMNELYNYIIEGTYTDEYITVTDSMTYAEKFSQMKTLYDRAKIQLRTISTPSQEYDVDVGSFVFVKDFADWTEQLETGSLINVELETNDVAELFLSNMTVNYDDKTLSMTFGNRFNKYDPKALYKNALGDLKRNTNSIQYLKNITDPVRNGAIENLQTTLSDMRNLTKLSVLTTDNQQVTIDDTGYTGRRFLGNDEDGNPVYDAEQIKISNKSIVFTDDEWETCRTALGSIDIGEGNTVYGLNAEVVMGTMIIGNELHIVDEDGTPIIDATADEVIARIGGQIEIKDVSNIVEEYYLSTSDTTQTGGEWSSTPPSWTDESGTRYLWTRFRIQYHSTQTQDVLTTPVLSRFTNGAYSQIIQNKTDITNRVTSVGGSASSFSWVLTSSGFVLNSNNTEVFRCDSDGIIVSGTINAENGEIGGWAINSDSINNGIEYDGEKDNNSTGMGTFGDHTGFWAGDGNFTVDETGHVNASDIRFEGSDGAYAEIDSDSFKFVDENGKDRFYYDSDLQTFVFDGTLASTDVIAETLYASEGIMADLTVDRLSTSKRIKKFLLNDTSDDYYVDIKDNSIRFINGTPTGINMTLQTENYQDILLEDGVNTIDIPAGETSSTYVYNRNNQQLFWAKDITHAIITPEGIPTIDGKAVLITTANTGYPVRAYHYDETVQSEFKITHDDATDTYRPQIVWGTGLGAANQAKIYKTYNSMNIDYTASDGTPSNISINDTDKIWRIGGVGIKVVDAYPSSQLNNVLYVRTGTVY